MALVSDGNVVETQNNKDQDGGYVGIDSGGNISLGKVVIYQTDSSNLTYVVPAQGQWVLDTTTQAVALGDGNSTFPALFPFLTSDNAIIGTKTDAANLTASYDHSVLVGGSSSAIILDDGSPVVAGSCSLLFEDILSNVAEIRLVSDNFSGIAGPLLVFDGISTFVFAGNLYTDKISPYSEAAVEIPQLRLEYTYRKTIAEAHAGTITPDATCIIHKLGTMTGNISILEPTASVGIADGFELIFTGKTATTSHTLSWDGIFKFGASGSTTDEAIITTTILALTSTNFRVEFMYDSDVSGWVCTSIVYGY